MRDEPVGLTRDQVAANLCGHWGIDPAELTYAPVGFGSYHWLATDAAGPRWFVTADHLPPHGSWLGPTPERCFTALTAAASACRELADRSYQFVVAPVPDRTGTLVRRVGPDWALQVFPYLAGWSTDYGEWHDPDERRQVAELVGRLHAAEPPAALRRWDFSVPGRESLVAALAEICGYVQLFRQPHAETTDSAESWRNLCHYTPDSVVA